MSENNKVHKRPAWFKVYDDLAIPAKFLTDEEVGKAFKYMLEYFVNGTIPDESSDQPYMLFLMAKKNIDNSIDAYYKQVEAGRNAAKNKQEKKPVTDPDSFDYQFDDTERRKKEFMQKYGTLSGF